MSPQLDGAYPSAATRPMPTASYGKTPQGNAPKISGARLKKSLLPLCLFSMANSVVQVNAALRPPSRSLRGPTDFNRTNTTDSAVEWLAGSNISSSSTASPAKSPSALAAFQYAQDIRSAIQTLVSAPFGANAIFSDPALRQAIESDLGYRAAGAYIEMLSSNPDNNFDNVTNTVELSAPAQTDEQNRLEGFADTVNQDAPLICNLNTNSFSDTSPYEVLRLVPEPRVHQISSQDTLVSFDGPNAGRTANAFVKLYQHGSDAFRSALLALTQRQNGLYPIHTARLHPNLGGYNYAYDDAYGLSGSYLNEQISDEWHLLHVLVHEISHDLHDLPSNIGLLDGLTRDTGQAHSREQSAFIVSVMAELVSQGVLAARHTDSIDYANDLSLVDLFLPPTDATVDGSYASNNPDALDTLRAQIADVLTNINTGEHDTAVQTLADLPPDASITLKTINPQTGLTNPSETYNVRELILQHCLIGYNAERFYGQDHSGLTNLKSELPNFLNALNKQDPSFMQFLENAANALYLPVRHLPISGNDNQVTDPPARVTHSQNYGPYSSAPAGRSCSPEPISHRPTEIHCEKTEKSWQDSLQHWQTFAMMGGSYALGILTLAAVNKLRQ